ncbi:MAG TPA: acylhydrolase [Cyanobacteria bacterium UBA8543]|nr:acylhydrolase [Cyanobacteria bacterium UBA8543]
MSEPYLLAASFLVTGPISVPPLPPLPPNLPDNLGTLLTSTAAHTLQSAVTPKMVPIVEIAAVEFSQPQPSLVKFHRQTTSTHLSQLLTPATGPAATNPPTLLIPQSTAASPVSGTQLYLQRLVALKAGKIYTNLPANSFQSFWIQTTNSQGLLLKPPTHEQWIRLLQEEAKVIANGQGSNHLGILLGDSLSMWFPSEGFPSNRDRLWLNQGISGENSAQILNRLSAFSQTRPDTIYVLAGINDLRQGASDEVILNNLRKIMYHLRLNHPKSQVIMQSILPTRLNGIFNERIRNLNKQIALVARQEGAGYLNLYSLFVDGQGQLRQELTTDGIHLTRRGYEVWQQALNYAENSLAASRVARANK